MRRCLILVCCVALILASCGGTEGPEVEVSVTEAPVTEVSVPVAEVSVPEVSVVDASGTQATTAVPSQIVDLISGWYAALERRDGSVVGFYQSDGYHLYGVQRFELDAIAGHLEDPDVVHEWITDPYLMVNEPDSRYVVVRGMRNQIGANRTFASVLTFTIIEASSGEMEIAYSAWTKVDG